MSDFKNIKVKINKYRLDISKPLEREQYSEIVEKCTNLGHKFDQTLSVQWSKEFYKALPDETVIDTEYLFSNQYNTMGAHRIYGWSECIYPNSDIKEGYYLTGDLELLEQAKENQLKCGYCGHRVWKDESEGDFCSKCLHSEYLTEGNLYMLRLLPVTQNDHRPKDIPEKLLEEFNNRAEQMEINRREGLKVKAKELRQKFKDDYKIKEYENEVQCALLVNGIDTENLIYYSHKGAWVYGWREPVSVEGFDKFKMLCSSIEGEIPTDHNDIYFTNVLYRNGV